MRGVLLLLPALVLLAPPALAQQDAVGAACIAEKGTAAEIVQACTSELDSPNGVQPKYRVNLLLSRADAYASQNNGAAAMADFAAALELQPANMDIFRSRGEALFKLKDYSDAVADFTKAISLQSPGTDKTYLSDIYYARAKAYRALAQTAAADADYAMALSLDQRKPPCAQACQ